MMQSESIAELATALALAQSQIEGAAKDSANPFFNSKYADLESVWGACRKALNDNGLSVAQFGAIASQPSHVAVVTQLCHKSGQWVRGVLELPLKKADDPQAAGSAITYARRYSLAAMVGVVQTDDDGEAATRQTRKPDKSVAIEAWQADNIRKLLADANGDETRFMDWLKKSIKVDSIDAIPAAKFDTVVSMIEASAKKRGAKNQINDDDIPS